MPIPCQSLGVTTSQGLALGMAAWPAVLKIWSGPGDQRGGPGGWACWERSARPVIGCQTHTRLARPLMPLLALAPALSHASFPVSFQHFLFFFFLSFFWVPRIEPRTFAMSYIPALFLLHTVSNKTLSYKVLLSH